MTRLLDRVFGRASRDLDAELEWSSLVSTYSAPDQERILPGFDQFASNAFAGNSIIYSLISRRIALFSEAVFKYRDLADKHLFGDQSLSKLEDPWPNGSTGELLARMEQDASLAGNAFVRDAGSRLERLRPDWVTIISHVTQDDLGRYVRDVVGYLFEPVGDPDRRSELYMVDEVVHWSPMPDPFANFRGMSWITPVIREINADVAMTAHREAFFRNAATPNIVLKYQQKLAPAQRDQIRDAVAARHAGNRNAFGTMVLDQGADMTIVGDRMQGSAFSDIQAAGETRLAAAAGVPSLVAGFMQGRQNGAPGEYADAVRGFVDLTIRPNWRTACSALQKFSSPPPGTQLWFDTTDISALQPGQKDAAGTMQVQAATANTLIMGGWTPESIIPAVTAGDMTLLKHSGLSSVQMQAMDGSDKTPAAVEPAPSAGDDSQPDEPPAPSSAPAAKSRQMERGYRSAEIHDGAMVALIPSDADAKRLAVPGGETVDQLHVTLAYLGNGADFSPNVRQALSGMVAETVAGLAPVEGDGFALSVFNPGTDSEQETCIVLGLAGDAMCDIHDLVESVVERALSIIGPPLPDQHSPWIPHLTLIYTNRVGQIADLTNRVGPVAFDRIRIVFAGDYIDIPLTGDTADDPEASGGN